MKTLFSTIALAGILLCTEGQAQTTAVVTATCKDGTAFSGTSRSGACSGHGGVQTWGTATAPAATATPSSAATVATPSNTTQAPGGGPGLVWVNTASKVYHCPGDVWYGKTKLGAYMTEAKAKAGGSHADHNKTCGS